MKNILIIEDSKTINNIIYKELTALKFKVSQAFTLADAQKFLVTKKYQLIILDMHLPDGEGSELIANIQSLTKTKVVVLTSTQDEDLREELFGYGILDYIIKDTNLLYSVKEIIKIINTVTVKTKEKILIIDDSKFICKQVKTILEPRNYTIKSAFTAHSGLQKLQKEHFNLIILDMELPDIHGIKVLEHIRKESRLQSIPIIVLSGTSTPEIVRNVLKNGANDFLKKPFVFEEFILKIDLWINYFKKERELQEKTFKLQFMNENLERLVYEEVEKSRKKDKIMFTQSRQAQMGEMIAMIAHQWRQPLNAISAATSVIILKAQRGTLDSETAKDMTSKIYKHIQYLSSTIDDFRDFFKPEKKMKSSNFELILTKVLTLTQDSLKNKNIQLEIKVNNNDNFMSYENELIQVVLNLLKNAEIALIDRETNHPKIEITIDKNSLEILDNAGGISNEIINKIFDPYFSTKTDKNGTGLGLYMSKIIIEEHCHGKLAVQNMHHGAKFTITLPKDGGTP
jgi:DNA-binding response OmpR family regulator